MLFEKLIPDSTIQDKPGNHGEPYAGNFNSLNMAPRKSSLAP